MHRTPFTAVLSAVTILVAAFGLAGCSDEPPAAPAPSSASTRPNPAGATPPAAPLPAPEALTDVLAKLADVTVPGDQKLALVAQSGPADAAALDRFGKALADNGFLPLTFQARDLTWSRAHRGDVTATVVVTTPNPQAGQFSFPMEFHPQGPGWQLTRGTADMLLDFGAAQSPPP